MTVVFLVIYVCSLGKCRVCICAGSGPGAADRRIAAMRGKTARVGAESAFGVHVSPRQQSLWAARSNLISQASRIQTAENVPQVSARNENDSVARFPCSPAFSALTPHSKP